MPNELTQREQIIEYLNQLSLRVHEYYKALRLQGFNEEMAFALTMEYQKQIIFINTGRDE